MLRWLLFGCLAALTSACASSPTVAVPAAPLTHDADRRPFRAKLEPYYSPTEWDYLDHSYFRPVSRLFAVDPGGEAVNVNALDEVPDSSWYENRVERTHGAEAARGACSSEAIDDRSRWQIVSGKPDGVYAGFVVKDQSGQRYLLKLDGGLQGPHNSSADVVGSRIYFAAGFDVPCNQVVYLDRASLSLAAHAKIVRENGGEEPMSWDHVNAILSRAVALPDGRFRAVASRYLVGRPLGPWRYEGTRADDRNDVVAHEDRRELRGSRLLAAWTGHWDQREQNTLAMWIDTGDGLGFVRHHLLDFGDCFGAFAGPTALVIKRRGFVHWFDPEQILTDFATLGSISRPWDRVAFGPSGAVFGYYDVERFDPEAWRPTYPNPAFERMSERDAAWMARIIAQIGPDELHGIVAAARLEPSVGRTLEQLLEGRRRKILLRYSTRLSPLGRVSVNEIGRRAQLCAHDLAVEAGVAARRSYLATGERAGGYREPLPVTRLDAGYLCVELPAKPFSVLDVELVVSGPAPRPGPARFRVYGGEGAPPRLLAIERAGPSDAN